MITDKMAKALNQQMNAELYSAYLYLAMASWAGNQGMRGASNWFFVQSQEEMTHVWRFYNYASSQGRQVILEAVEKPDVAAIKGLFDESALKGAEGAMSGAQLQERLNRGNLVPLRESSDLKLDVYASNDEFDSRLRCVITFRINYHIFIRDFYIIKKYLSLWKFPLSHFV